MRLFGATEDLCADFSLEALLMVKDESCDAQSCTGLPSTTFGEAWQRGSSWHDPSGSQPRNTTAGGKSQVEPRSEHLRNPVTEAHRSHAATKLVSNINLASLCHWRDGKCNTKKNRQLWLDAMWNMSNAGWIHVDRTRPSIITVEQAWSQCGTSDMVCTKVDDFVASPGSWFYKGFPQTFDPRKKFRKPETAYHGTSLTSASMIIRDGLEVGPTGSKRKGKEQIACYFETGDREHLCFPYAVHRLFQCNGLLTAAVIEAIVDRARSVDVQKQLAQPPGTFVITGVFTHQLPVTKLYESEKFNSLCVHKSVWTALTSSDYQ